jgi:hypothetical protein
MKALIGAASFLIISTLVGCATHPPTAEQERSANYGEISEIATTKLILNYLNATLIDPYSAHITTYVSSANKYWAADRKGAYHFGWLVGYTVNAKNRMGGYTGNKKYLAFIENEQIVQIYEPFDSGDCCYPEFHTIR